MNSFKREYDVFTRTHQLSFVFPGYSGEAFEVPMQDVDLAFVLQERLKRMGWRDEGVEKSVGNFMERSMCKAVWRGKDGEYGILESTRHS